MKPQVFRITEGTVMNGKVSSGYAIQNFMMKCLIAVVTALLMTSLLCIVLCWQIHHLNNRVKALEEVDSVQGDVIRSIFKRMEENYNRTRP